MQYFGLSTFTTGIFRTWYGLDNAAAASQLAAVLIAVRPGADRRRERLAAPGPASTTTSQPPPADLRRIELTGWKGWAAFGFCSLLAVGLGFLVPAGQLAAWSVAVADHQIDDRFAGLVWNSIRLAGLAAGLSVGVAVLLGYGRRLHRTKAVQGAVRLAGMGYAVPGTVIAVGVIIPFAWADNTFDAFMRETFGVSTGLILSGTIAALLFAYLVRFLAVSLQAVNTGLERIKPSLDEAARVARLPPVRGGAAGCISRCSAAACSPPCCWCSSTC